MATRAGNKTPAQLFALAFGVVYLAVGIVGIFVTKGFGNFAHEHTANYDKTLLIFHLNPLHNIVHIVLGLVWIGAAGRHSAAAGVNTLFGVVLLLVFVLGLFDLHFLAIDGAGDPDNYLHLATGLLAVYFGTAGAAGPGTART
jgi:hypothetical protein